MSKIKMKENQHQIQLKNKDRYITNLTKGTKVKVVIFGKKMFLKEGQALDLFTFKKVDFLKKRKERDKNETKEIAS